MWDRTRSPRGRSSSFRLFLAFCLVLACARPPVVVELPPVAPSPPPPTAELRPPPPERPPRVTLLPLGPLQIRVGLATDLERLELPCCDGEAVLHYGEERWPLTEPTSITPLDALVKNPVYRLQVASLKDERQAQGVAEYLTEATGRRADAVFDADTDLYKVRFGTFDSKEDARRERETLAGLGLTQAWVTSEGSELENPGFMMHRGDEKEALDGRWLEIHAPEGSGIAVHRGRYRGRVLIFLNDRGLLNVINELDLEEYLRGVVPKEMGPELYNQIEALKAQTVAARTYAVKNLREFSSEGYDICSTPRCQVYGGMKVEHRVSDRAIADTAGQVVLYGGEPAETFYGATCGGHTENVEVIFPLKSGAHLKGVPCMEAGLHHIAGMPASTAEFPHTLTRHLLPPTVGGGAENLTARLESLARLAGLSLPRDRLSSLRRGEVVRFLGSAFDLVLDPRVLSPALDVAAPPADFRPHDVRLAAYLQKSSLLSDPSEAELGEDEVETLLFHLAYYLGVLRDEKAHFLSADGERLTVRTSSGPRTWTLAEKRVTLRRQGSAFTTEALELAAGDRIELYFRADRVVGLVQPVEARPVSLRRHAPRQRWSDYKSHRELRQAVQTRYPGFPFEGFEVLSRGISGRVGKLELLGEGGRRQRVEGLAVRWTLDIPDTLFEVRREQNGSRDGWYFKGRGWGHGVGMCQAGAFGMAVRNVGYREILEHYYSGVELGLVQKVRGRARPFLGP